MLSESESGVAPVARTDIETMHELFDWCARRWPSAVAIVHGDRRVSYGELAALSDDYAVELTNNGVGRGDRVPVLMSRTPEFVATLLAILKCGAAYAAFDVRWPAGRLTSLIAVLDAKLLVTAIDGQWPVPVIAPPSAANGLGIGRRPQHVEVRGDEPCSVFFTSGSTGTPKAVVSPHMGTVRLFADCDFASLGPGNAVPQTAPVPWDGFTLDCWSVLLNGGTSVFVDDPVLVPSTLRAMIAEQGVSGAFLTTALFNMLVDEDIDCFDGMRWLLTGGERASTGHMLRFVERFPDIELNNMYGPVEASVVVTARRVTVADCADPAGVPLGRVLNGTEIFVLDGDRPCAAGQTGELCIAGSGLVYGYLGDAEQTARKFVEVTVDGATHRVYRTGDLGHYSAEHVLYFDGRDDRQVKIAGHRIEPAEIELAAERIDGVTAAVVVPVAGEDGRYRSLYLCYSGSAEYVPDEQDVRTRLAVRLPSYLVPASIRRLPEMPLLPNAKIDLRAIAALAAEDDHADESTPGERAALAEVEARLAALFEVILRRRSVPLDASLFELGANSLDVARLCAQVDLAFGVTLPASVVFAAPTVRDLAKALTPLLDLDAQVDAVEAADGDAVDGEAEGESIALPAHYSFYLWEGISEDSDIAYLCPMAWWIDGAVDVDALRLALRDVHRRHQALHSRYVMEPEPTALPFGGADEPEFGTLPDAATDDAALAALDAALFRPLSLAKGEIWRCAMVRSVASRRLLFGLGVHHVAFDGASESTMAADLTTAYQARVNDREPEFDGPANTLAEFVDTYHRRRGAADIDAQRDYWHSELDGLPQLELPQRLDSTATAGPKASSTREVSAEALASWDDAVRQLESTRLLALTVACGAVLRRLSGQDEFGILVPFSRRIGEPGRSISTRVDMLCLRLRQPKDQASQLASTQRVIGAALAAQDTSFTEAAMPLLAGAGGDTVLRLPVLLVQNDVEPKLALPSCRTEFIRPDTPTTMTELEIQVRDIADGGVRLTVTVWTDKFPPEFAERFVAEFHQVLSAGPVELPVPAEAR